MASHLIIRWRHRQIDAQRRTTSRSWSNDPHEREFGVVVVRVIDLADLAGLVDDLDDQPALTTATLRVSSVGMTDVELV